ncbi:hypothetical protein I5907_17020 [Panacibacter sp. DH6]|uniref:Uncharacterized protein n=1 Tax=Panacibacter microcysteis TaxID=2793269 RepID=A0A931GYZ3_9BACT|nr:hypothetical protein [Panacibacter microcysteis]MBG9377944.1 hypothetical protein [Panacibacter microcysteis]
MTDEFILTTNYNETSRDFKAHLLLQGFSYKIVVQIDEMDVYFERDEESNFRVVTIPGQDVKKLEKIDKQLLQLLADELTVILR